MLELKYAVMGDDVFVPVAVFKDLNDAIGFCHFMTPITNKVINRLTGKMVYNL